MKYRTATFLFLFVILAVYQYIKTFYPTELQCGRVVDTELEAIEEAYKKILEKEKIYLADTDTVSNFFDKNKHDRRKMDASLDIDYAPLSRNTWDTYIKLPNKQGTLTTFAYRTVQCGGGAYYIGHMHQDREPIIIDGMVYQWGTRGPP